MFGFGPGDREYGVKERNGVLTDVYDEDNKWLTVVERFVPSNIDRPTDENGVWSAVYNPTLHAIRIVYV